jgi:cyclin-dependent kinase 7
MTCSFQALYHPYFFALPYPSHPSKLPKCTSKLTTSSPLEEVDGNVDMNPPAAGVKAKSSLLKRKLTSPEDGRRTIARRLDFTAHVPGS